MLTLVTVILGAAILGRRFRDGPRPAWLAALVPAGPLSPPAGSPWDRLWELAGALAVGGAFAYLQVAQPFAFSQGDVLTCELPGMLVGLRGAWAGHWPEYNPFQLLGSPLAGSGVFSLTYPPTYIAYSLARHGLGNELLTAEAFAALHLAAGYVLARRLGERLNLSAPVAVLAALSFCLCGYQLIFGRAWHTAVPLWAWLPAAGLCVARLARGGVGIGWAAATGGCLAAVWHVGFPQYALYAGCFALLACGLLGAAGATPWRRLRWLVPALLLAAALSAPLAWCQWSLSRGLVREPVEGLAPPPLAVVLSTLGPYPLVSNDQPTSGGRGPSAEMGQAYFSGGVLSALLLARLLAAVALRPGRAARGGLATAACGGVALWLALGDAGGLWHAVTRVPVVGPLNRWPVRVLPFLALFAALAGGDVLERLRRANPGVTRAVILLAAGLLVYHVYRCGESLRYHGFGPYPPRDGWAGAAVPDDGYRAAGWCRTAGATPHFWRGLPQNLASAYGVPVATGLDPVGAGSPAYRAAEARLEAEPLAAARAYGLRWHLVHASARSPELCENPGVHHIERQLPLERTFLGLAPDALPLVASDDQTTLHELSGCDPLAFARANPRRALPVSLHAGGVDADVSGLPAGSEVVLNFLHSGGIDLFLDGVRVESAADGWGRVAVALPAAGERLALRRRAPWGAGLALGGGLLVLAALSARALRGGGS